VLTAVCRITSGCPRSSTSHCCCSTASGPRPTRPEPPADTRASNVGSPTCRQSTPYPRGPDLHLRGSLASRPASSPWAVRLTTGVHPIAERGPALRRLHRPVLVRSGTVLRTKVHDPRVRVPGGPACAPGCCSAIGWTPQSVPGPWARWCSSVPSGSAVRCVLGAGAPCARPAPAVPAPWHARR